MGIYDRDYYRKEGPSFLGSIMRTGEVCKWLMIINVVVYIIQLVTMQDGNLGPFTSALVMKPAAVFSGDLQLWRILTGAFLHSPFNWQHIVWNMLFLWFFGPDLEEMYGHREFLFFYLLGGIVGNLFWGLTTIATVPAGFPVEWLPFALGASGAVTAVMVLAAFHFPHRTVLLMFIIPVPLWLLAIIHVGGDLFYFLRGMNIGIAVAAHLGGAGFAALYYKLGWRLLGAWPRFQFLMRRPARSHLRVYREPAATPSRTVRAATADEQLEAKADAVLAKLNSVGYDNLSPEEKSILQQASERYKKKRT